MATETVRLWPTSPIWDAVGIGHERGDHFGLGIGGYVDVPKGPQALALLKRGGYVEMPEPVAVQFGPSGPALVRHESNPKAIPGGGVPDGKGNFLVPSHIVSELRWHGFHPVTDEDGQVVQVAQPGGVLDRLQEIEPLYRDSVARVAAQRKVIEEHESLIVVLKQQVRDLDAAMKDAAEQIVARDAQIAELTAFDADTLTEEVVRRGPGRPRKEPE
jgi:hypothetical protein